jgi:two-component system chemotaxis response regulator CheB
MSGNGHNVGEGLGCDLVVVLASYGGVAAGQRVFGGLPAEFPAPILLVQHRHGGADFLAPIVARRTPLVVADGVHGELPRRGTIHVLPADRQTTLDAEGRLTLGPAGHCHGDALLESVAPVYGRRAIAVILTGRLQDGAAGVRAVKRHGGRVIAQDQETSAAFAMPAAAIATGCVDFVLPLSAIAPALVSLAMVPGAADLFRVRRNPWANVA